MATTLEEIRKRPQHAKQEQNIDVLCQIGPANGQSESDILSPGRFRPGPPRTQTVAFRRLFCFISPFTALDAVELIA
jgi:hypothetical protein